MIPEYRRRLREAAEDVKRRSRPESQEATGLTLKAFVSRKETLIRRLNNIATYDVLLQLLDDVDRIEAERNALRDLRDGSVWYWQGDGEDHPESLSCPVLIEAADIRELCAAEAALVKLRKDYDEEISWEKDTVRTIAMALGLKSCVTVPPILQEIERRTKEYDAMRVLLERARSHKGIEAWPCPLCRYEDGVFIEACEPCLRTSSAEAALAEAVATKREWLRLIEQLRPEAETFRAIVSNKLSIEHVGDAVTVSLGDRVETAATLQEAVEAMLDRMGWEADV